MYIILKVYSCCAYKRYKIYLAYKLFVLVYLDIFFPYTHEHVVSPGIAQHTCLSKQGEHVSPLMYMKFPQV